MGLLLMVIGYGWAVIGLGNIVMYDNFQTASDAAVGFLFMFNVLLFILPGLVVGAMGQNMRKKQSKE